MTKLSGPDEYRPCVYCGEPLPAEAKPYWKYHWECYQAAQAEEYEEYEEQILGYLKEISARLANIERNTTPPPTGSEII